MKLVDPRQSLWPTFDGEAMTLDMGGLTIDSKLSFLKASGGRRRQFVLMIANDGHPISPYGPMAAALREGLEGFRKILEEQGRLDEAMRVPELTSQPCLALGFDGRPELDGATDEDDVFAPLREAERQLAEDSQRAEKLGLGEPDVWPTRFYEQEVGGGLVQMAILRMPAMRNPRSRSSGTMRRRWHHGPRSTAPMQP